MESTGKKSNPLYSNSYQTTDFIWAASLGEGKFNINKMIRQKE